MIDRYKDSFYRKLSLEFKKENMELIQIFNLIRKSMLKEVKGKKTYE